MMKKLFSCIGAQKAGTTWLHAMLSKDSRLSFPRYVKETHYFSWLDYGDTLIHRWRAGQLKKISENEKFVPALEKWLGHSPDDFLLNSNPFQKKIATLLSPVDNRWYESLFHETEDFCVDITPEYAKMGSDGFRRMALSTERLDLLFLLRDPVDRSWSGLVQGMKGKLDQAALQLKVSEMSQRELLNDLAKPNIADRSDYVKTFMSIDDAGLTDRLMVGFYEEIKNISSSTS